MHGRIETNNLQALSWAIIVFTPPEWAGPLRLSSYQTPHVRWVAPCLLVNGYLRLGVLRKDGVSFQLNCLGRKQQNPTKILSVPLLASFYQ